MARYEKILAEAATDNAEASEPTAGADDLSSYENVAVYCEFSDGVSGGTVVVETAHRNDFGGTWKSLGSFSGADWACDRLALSGTVKYLRYRISSAVTGGPNPSARISVVAN